MSVTVSSADAPRVRVRPRSAVGYVSRPLLRWVLELAPFFIALPVYLSAFLIMDPLTTGDEPHYLVLAHSLVHDFDVDLQNNYVEDVVLRYYRFPLTGEQHTVIGHDGRLISSHFLGLPLLLAPVMFLGGGLLAVRLELILISALLAHQLFGLLSQLRLGGYGLTWLVWAAVMFGLPLLVYSDQVYPEMPAALLAVLGARTVVARAPTGHWIWVAMLAAAALPWLHVRYVPVAVAIGLGVTYRLLGSPSVRGLPSAHAELLAATAAPCDARPQRCSLHGLPAHELQRGITRV